MFLPMSWTSPFTVAITMVPCGSVSSPAASARARSSSMKGSRWADGPLHDAGALHHLGQEHLPEPNRSPTTFIPAISGPSITASGRSVGLAGLLRVRLDVVDDPVHQRVLEALLHRALRQASSATRAAPPSSRTRSASSTSRSVASARRSRRTSSTASSSSSSICS